MRAVPRYAWLILALALLLRVGATAVLTDRLEPGSDERSYISLAHSIQDGDAYSSRFGNEDGGPTAALLPGYPTFLAGVFTVTGDSVGAARVANVLLGTLVVGLLGWIAWRLWASRRIALSVMGVAAVYPPLIMIGVSLLTEPLFFTLALGSIAAGLEYRRDPRLRWVLTAGLLAGAAAMTKNVGLILALGTAAMMIPPGRPGFAALRAPAVFAAVAALVLAPWVIRNNSEFETLTFTSTELGFGLAGTYNELTRADSSHYWRSPYDVPEYERILTDPSLDESQASRELQSRSIDFATGHPGYTATMLGLNGARMFELRPGGPPPIDAELSGFSSAAAGSSIFKALFRLNQLSFFVLAALAIFAVRLGALRRVPWALAVAFAATIAPLLVIEGGTRFRLPFDLMLILLAGTAVAWAVDRWGSRSEAAAD